MVGSSSAPRSLLNVDSSRSAWRAARPSGLATDPTPALVRMAIVLTDVRVISSAPPMPRASNKMNAPAGASRACSGSAPSAPMNPPDVCMSSTSVIPSGPLMMWAMPTTAMAIMPQPMARRPGLDD